MISYPEFSGGADEDVAEFLEGMEVACISNHIADPVQIIRLLQICLKGDARTWCRDYEKQLRESVPPVQLELDGLKQALLAAFEKQEDPDKIWHNIQALTQAENQTVDEYIKKFLLLWEILCEALGPNQQPPDMIKKDRFLAGLGEAIRWKVELKRPKSFEDAVDIARSKEWKLKRMSHLGITTSTSNTERRQTVEPSASVPIVPQVAPIVASTTVGNEELRQDMRQMVDMMKDLSLNLLNNVGGGRGRGRIYNQASGEDQRRSGGGGRGYGRGWRNPPTCYNCGELGHISPECDKPPRMGGDMYPLPSQLPNRSNDYSVEIKNEAGPSGLSREEKGKTKVLSVVSLEKKATLEDAAVMPLGKRTTEEKEARGAAGPSKKKGKAHEGEDAKAKRKRRPRRKFHVSDFPLGDGQISYDLKEDVSNRKADVTFGQLIEMVPGLKRQWKKLVSPVDRERERGSVKVMSLDELPDICPIVDVWHRRKNLGQAYVDGGAQICVITHSCVERLGLTVDGVSGFRIRLANHQKVKCLGVVKELEVEAYDVKTIVDFHVMPAGLGSYPIILGRPWLRAVGAVQDWRHGTIRVQTKTGIRKLFDMDSRKPLKHVQEEDSESTDEDSSTISSYSDIDSDSSSSSEEEVDVAFLHVEKKIYEKGMIAQVDVDKRDLIGPYEVVE